MSREHLYKAKEIESGLWFEGDLIHEISGQGRRTCIYRAVGRDRWQTVAVDDSTVCECSIVNGKKIWTNDIYSFFDDFYKAHMLAVVRFGEYEQDTTGSGNMMPIIGFYVEILKWEYTEESFYDEEEFPESLRKTSLLNIMDKKFYKDLKRVGNVFDNPKLCLQK